MRHKVSNVFATSFYKTNLVSNNTLWYKGSKKDKNILTDFLDLHEEN